MSFYDKKRKPKQSIIKEYRELSLNVSLKAGRYVIVPTCKTPNSTGEFFLNIYFSKGQEDHSGGKDDTFKYFTATYANPSELEEKDHLHGFVIKEEDEDDKHFDEQFKKVLEIKAKYAIFNDDEDAD